MRAYYELRLKCNVDFLPDFGVQKPNLLSINLKLGDSDEINKHVAFKYKLISYNLQRSRAKLEEVCSILKSKNPSLITQINKAAMIS